MLTLFTLPICPRCDMIKAKLGAARIEYVENTDPAKAEEFSDKFWPLGLDGNGTLYEFPDLLAYISTYREANPNPVISSIEIEGQITLEEVIENEV